MKNILFIALLSISLNLYSQDKIDDYKKMIDSSIVIKSIETYKNFKEDLDKKIDTENWKYYIGNYKLYIENIYLIDGNNRPYSITLSENSDIKFKQIDIYSKENKKTIKKGIDAWKIVTSLEGNKLKIVIIDFKINYIKGNYKFVNGGGKTIIFEYLCQDKKWILTSNKTNAL